MTLYNKNQLLLLQFLLLSTLELLLEVHSFVDPRVPPWTRQQVRRLGENASISLSFSSQNIDASTTLSSPSSTTSTSTRSPMLEGDHDIKMNTSGMIIELIETIDQFLSFVSKHTLNSLCVIKFYSDTCPTCRRTAMKYKKIAYKYSKQFNHRQGEEIGNVNKNTHVYFAKINSSTNKDNLPSLLDIKEFPFIHIYRNQKCVASFGTGPPDNFTKMLEYMLDHELAMSEDDWIWFENAFAKQVEDGTAKIHKLKEVLVG